MEARTDNILQKTGEDFSKRITNSNVKSQIGTEDLKSIKSMSELPEKELAMQHQRHSTESTSSILNSNEQANDRSSMRSGRKGGGMKSVRSMGLNKGPVPDYYINSANLSRAQKDYEPKTVPKYYKPVNAERRFKYFERAIPKLR